MPRFRLGKVHFICSPARMITLDWSELETVACDGIPTVYRHSSGTLYFGGRSASPRGGPSLVPVKMLFDEFQNGGQVNGFLNCWNVKQWQVESILRFVQDNAPEPMKQLFQWLGEGLTVKQILDTTRNTTQQQVDIWLGDVQGSLAIAARTSEPE